MSQPASITLDKAVTDAVESLASLTATVLNSKRTTRKGTRKMKSPGLTFVFLVDKKRKCLCLFCCVWMHGTFSHSHIIFYFFFLHKSEATNLKKYLILICSLNWRSIWFCLNSKICCSC